MKILYKKRIAFLLALMMVFSVFHGVGVRTKTVNAATWPAVSTSKYIKCYTISTGNNTTAYTTSSLRTKKGTIYGTDELYVYNINNSYAYISYPVKGGRKYAYIPTRVITPNNQSHVQTVSRAKITTYKRAGSGSYGYISKGDWVMKVASSGNYSQVIYPTGSTMKMGWITTSSYNSYIAVSSTNNNNNNNSQSSVTTKYESNSSAGKLSTYGSGKVKGFTLASSGKLYAYSDVALKNRTTGSYIACATDEVYVQGVNLTYGSVLLSYPVSKGRKSMYFKLTDIMVTPAATPSSYYADHKIYTYRRASSSNSYGYIQNETVTVVGTSGSYTQIIYSIASGYYKMGFIKTSDMGNAATAIPSSTNNQQSKTVVQGNIYKLAISSLGTKGVVYQRWAGLSVYDPYCVAYATYIANQAMIKSGYSSSQALSIVPKMVSTAKMADWFRNRGQYHSYATWYNSSRGVRMYVNTGLNAYTPQVGDLVVIDNDGKISSGPEHTGLVIEVGSSYIKLAEGNTGSGTNATRIVRQHTYKKGSDYWYRTDYTISKIVGFASPAY